MEKKFVIFLNGEYKYSQEFMNRLVSEETICFCADGGANFAFQYGKVPEMIIGDLDSIEKKVLEYYKNKNRKKQRIWHLQCRLFLESGSIKC